MGGSEDGAGGTGTVLDALLKFITLDKLGVSIADIAKASTADQAIPAAAAVKPAAPEAAPKA